MARALRHAVVSRLARTLGHEDPGRVHSDSGSHGSVQNRRPRPAVGGKLRIARSLSRGLRQVGGVTGAIPVGSLCLAFFVLVVVSVVKNALLSMLTSASQAGGKEEGEHMKHSFRGYATKFFASVSEVILGLGTSLLASAALTSGS